MNKDDTHDPVTLEYYRRFAIQEKVLSEIARWESGELTADQTKDEIVRFQDKIMKVEGEEILVLYRQVMGLDD